MFVIYKIFEFQKLKKNEQQKFLNKTQLRITVTEVERKSSSFHLEQKSFGL